MTIYVVRNGQLVEKQNTLDRGSGNRRKGTIMGMAEDTVKSLLEELLGQVQEVIDKVMIAGGGVQVVAENGLRQIAITLEEIMENIPEDEPIEDDVEDEDDLGDEIEEAETEGKEGI